MKSIDLTAIIQAILTLMSTVITIYILPKVKTYLAAKLSAEQRDNLKQWVKVAVAAAEQIYNGAGLGEDKYCYVISFLEDKGIYVNYKEVEALIESEVYKLSQGSGFFVTVPEEDTEVPGVPDINDSCEHAEESELDTADEGCESDTVEAVG